MNAPFYEISGGVTAPRGFRAAAMWCGIKHSHGGRDDLGMIVADGPAIGAATFTTNKIKAAPVRVSMTHLRSADLRGIIVNSGNANACTGALGILNAKRMAAAAAAALGLKEKQFLVCSTGRIGRNLPIERLESALPDLARKLSVDEGKALARAIMTSDTFEKEIAIEFTIRGKPVRIGGIAKGAGMINPDMATMLCFVTTDAVVAKRHLQDLFRNSVEQSFNRITIDGDMSTNDTAICLASGRAEIPTLQPEGPDFATFASGLHFVTRQLARMIVEDGEGASKFVEVHVKNAATYQDARKAAEAVANSTLVKCSWCGEDPNWGRVMDAIGYSTAKVREEMVDIFYSGVIAVKHGGASDTPEDKLQEVLRNKNFTVTIDLHLGTAEYKVFTTDLTPEYVRLNLGE